MILFPKPSTEPSESSNDSSTQGSSPEPEKQIRKRKEYRRSYFSDRQRHILLRWLHDHQSNPYPTFSEKQQLMSQTGLTRDQINVWFTNNRIRYGATNANIARRTTSRPPPPKTK